MFKLILNLSSRFAFTRHSNGFIKFIGAMSILGIILGITALSTTMAVLNGFDITVRDKLLNAVPHITVEAYDKKPETVERIEHILQRDKNIVSSYPLLQKPILSIENGKISPLYLNAMPNKYLKMRIKDLNIKNINNINNGIIISSQIADNLHKKVGDILNIATTATTSALNFKQIKIIGIFKNNDTISEKLALGSDNLINNLKITSPYLVYAVYVNDPLDVAAIGNKLSAEIGNDGFVNTWQRYFAGYFDALQYTKHILFLMLGIIILVAAFNLLATLIMIVTEKYADIAILRTLGASRKLIFNVFVIQGLLLSLIGIVGGVISGFVLTNNINELVQIISKILGHDLINQSVYIVNYLPTQFSWHEVLIIIVFTIALAISATLYPAWHACRKNPTEIL